jgi:hypothetical protein
LALLGSIRHPADWLLAIAVRRACIGGKRQHAKQRGSDCNEGKVLLKHCVVMPRKGRRLKRCLMLRLPAQHQVPDLTVSAGVNLNNQVVLRRSFSGLGSASVVRSSFAYKPRD